MVSSKIAKIGKSVIFFQILTTILFWQNFKILPHEDLFFWIRHNRRKMVDKTFNSTSKWKKNAFLTRRFFLQILTKSKENVQLLPDVDFEIKERFLQKLQNSFFLCFFSSNFDKIAFWHNFKILPQEDLFF